MNLVGLLLWFANSIGARVLVSLGIGFISYAGVGVAAASLADSVASAWGGIAGVPLALISLAGFPSALGWIIGAVIAKLTLTQISKIAKIPT